MGEKHLVAGADLAADSPLERDYPLLNHPGSLQDSLHGLLLFGQHH